MDRLRTILLVVTFLACTPPFAALGQNNGSAPASVEVVTILPEETDELLANPGIGWETFGRTRDKDKSLPNWIPSTVHYIRWGWGVLEPRPGEIDYAFLDKVLAESRVTFISPQVDNTTQSVLIKAGLEHPRGDARSSQFVRARVIWKAEPGLLIPVTAVSRVSGQYFAFVAEPKDKGLVARQRPVRLGPILGNDYVVLDGLEPGDRLIVSGAQNLVDGTPVVES